jgi:DNA polymerase III subunit chi
MTEIRFCHLEQRSSEQALPALVEEQFAKGVKVVVEAPDRELLARLDERLWTYSDDSFLPHAIAGVDAARQPILLTIQSDNPNGAAVRMLLGGAKAETCLAAAPDAYQRIVILFNGADADEIAAARAQWTTLKAAGRVISYWREGESGEWERVR